MSLIAITEADFEAEVIQSSLPVMVEFGATWCKGCQDLLPALEAIAEEYAGRVKVMKLDRDTAVPIFRHYRIRTLPMLLIFWDGGLVSAEMGWQSRFDADGKFIDAPHYTVDQLRAMIERTLNAIRAFG